MTEKKPRNNKLVYQYLGFAFTLMAGLALAVLAGMQVDKWIKASILIFTWLLPLVVLIAILIKVVKDTSGKQD